MIADAAAPRIAWPLVAMACATLAGARSQHHELVPVAAAAPDLADPAPTGFRLRELPMTVEVEIEELGSWAPAPSEPAFRRAMAADPFDFASWAYRCEAIALARSSGILSGRPEPWPSDHLYFELAVAADGRVTVDVGVPAGDFTDCIGQRLAALQLPAPRAPFAVAFELRFAR